MNNPEQTTVDSAQNDYHGERQALHAAYDRLTSALEVLSSLITQADAELPAYIAQLPLPPGKRIPKMIEPKTLYGPEARVEAARVLCKTLLEPEQDPSTVQRAPGLLAASEATLKQIAMINDFKKQLEVRIAGISPHYRIRKREIHKQLPQINLNETTRRIHSLEERPQSVSFTWATHTSGIVVGRTRQWEKELNDQLNNPTEGFTLTDWNERIQSALDQLRLIHPDEWLGQREPLAPHPRANIKPLSETPMKPASLPYFYPDNGSEELPAITPLTVMHKEIRRAPRKNKKLEGEPVVAMLHLYRYLEKYRSTDEPPSGCRQKKMKEDD